MQKPKINIIKVPNENNNNNKPQTQFPRMPRMYLELIENKDKIKPNMVNKEYDPDEVATVVSSNFQNESRFDVKPNIIEEKTNIIQESQSILESESIHHSSRIEESSIQQSNQSESFKSSDESPYESESVTSQSSHSKSQTSAENDDEISISSSNENQSQQDNSEKESSIKSSVSSSSKKSQFNNISSSIVNKSEIKQTTTREKLKEILKNPPKLSDLEKKGFVKTQKHIPNIETNTSIEEEDELKRELLYKFDLLKRSYKNVEIPDFTIHSDYKNMNKTYENTLRRVSLDTNVENYKNYMIAGFMLIEYLLSAWFKFDMSGFTQQQIINMNQYERLLIELGEKSYVPTDKQWPVELRLLGMILLNAVIFIIARIIIKKTGTNLFGLINTANSNVNTSPKKRKMKGPSLDLDSIPNLN